MYSDTAAIGRRPGGEWVWPRSRLLCPAQGICLICFFSHPPLVFSFHSRGSARTGWPYWDDPFTTSETAAPVMHFQSWRFSCLPARKCNFCCLTPDFWTLEPQGHVRASKSYVHQPLLKKSQWDRNNDWIHRSGIKFNSINYLFVIVKITQL